ncbi:MULTISPECIES: Ppx/GppA phosphatase family protein [unclassified Chelatococcus]|uniref:Ppx/GppA family phosphatase n=1 Tax=unclassified Chelatococcus TaxID=2638111 RepID=UPI00224BDAE1|nr:Ppx/GppA phosphatase family protein [Chelatococcus sp.]MCO5077391.1 Ppx/GppA family phosphatase [Chelatococcus sp.]CAH1669869.1 Exopolyphosphatase [Hyphomicrobiales bacterium]CAH1677893.1 Exopolyphosphatase [Hyphomicrobiales bacterium]
MTADRAIATGLRKALQPVAIVDIGSNSVRLVAYDGLTPAPTPLFNEKVLCGLGYNVALTGKLDESAMTKALRSLRRFRVICEHMQISSVHVLATAAARDATNGPAFLAAAEEAIGRSVELLSGREEAELSAYGVISSFHRPDGVVGDLGGGSLELINVKGRALADGMTLPIGGLNLRDVSGGSVRKAKKVVRQALQTAGPLDGLRGRSFYAVGGTWRALARLHMGQKGYPLHVLHGYTLTAGEAIEFAKIIERTGVEALSDIDAVSDARQPLLAYGALVLEEIVRRGKPKEIVISAAGVREGVLHTRLDADSRVVDPLLYAAREINCLRSRSPAHAEELIIWTDRLMKSLHIDETPDEKRLRHAACLLSDISWRSHPDYRGDQSMDAISQAAFVGIDHPGRAYIALAVALRHIGLSVDFGFRLRELMTARLMDRARILAGAMRIAYIASAAMPGTLPRMPLTFSHQKLQLHVPADLMDLANEKLQGRVKQLARLIGCQPTVVIGK